MQGPKESPGYSMQISPGQYSINFHARAVSVVSCKSLRLQQGQPLPALSPQIPEIHSRNIIAQAGLVPCHQKSFPGCTGHVWATQAECCCLLTNLWPKKSTGDDHLRMRLPWVICGLGSVGSQGDTG